MQAAVQANERALAEAMAADFRKAPMEVYMTETGMVLDEIRFHLKHLRAWMRETRVPTPLAQFPSRSFRSPEPYGVCLILAPWNYPIQLCLEPLIGAISGGNCAVVKPSAYAPATSRALAKLLGETFDPEYIAVVEGGREENKALLDERFDFIFFTGSPAVGRVVMQSAAKYLTPVCLELGGKSPVIVTESADIAVAARRIAFGKVLNAGQTCVEPDYCFVHKSVEAAFLDAYRKALAEFFPDGCFDEMPVIVNEKHYHRVKGLLAGQTAAIGGETDDETRFIAPTVLTGVSPESPINWTSASASSGAGKSRSRSISSRKTAPTNGAFSTRARSAAAASTTRSSIWPHRTCRSAASARAESARITGAGRSRRSRITSP